MKIWDGFVARLITYLTLCMYATFIRLSPFYTMYSGCYRCSSAFFEGYKYGLSLPSASADPILRGFESAFESFLFSFYSALLLFS